MTEPNIKDKVVQFFFQWDWVFFIALGGIITTYTWSIWPIIILWLAWAAWRIYFMWDTYIAGVDYIVTLLRVMRKGKFVWRKTNGSNNRDDTSSTQSQETICEVLPTVQTEVNTEPAVVTDTRNNTSNGKA